MEVSKAIWPPGGEKATSKKASLPPSLGALQSCVARLSAFARCLPLKIGIHQDLIALGHSKNAVRRYLGWWTKRREYLHALARGGYRYDLAGKLSGTITAEHIADAKQRLQGKKKRKVWEDLKTPKLSMLAKALPKEHSGKDVALEQLNLSTLARPKLSLKKVEATEKKGGSHD
jgi:sRNA-binding protein